MNEIKFRLAKPCDAKQIANCHWSVRERYKDGIFLSLGKPFLRRYYKIILNDPWEVIVCAEKKDGTIIGFSSGTQNAKSQAKNLKKHIFQLALSASFSVLLHPSLIKELVIRYKSLYGKGDAPKFITNENVRGEYWCWLPGEEAGMLSFKVDDIKNQILGDLGEDFLFGEVDKSNTSVLQYHKRFHHSEILEEIELPDGRIRCLLKTPLKKQKR